MARVKMPLMSAEVSGKLGGIEFKRGNYGNTVSLKSVTPFLRTTLQLENRAGLGWAQRAWKLLSDVDQAAWGEFATPPLDGRTAYVQAWLRLAPFLQPPDDDPIDLTKYQPPTSFVLDWFYQPQNLARLRPVGADDPGCAIFVYTRPLWGGGTYVHPKQMKLTLTAADTTANIYWEIRPNAPRTIVRVDHRSFHNAALLHTWLGYLDHT